MKPLVGKFQFWLAAAEPVPFGQHWYSWLSQAQ
jgi:hypothetical protein